MLRAASVVVACAGMATAYAQSAQQDISISGVVPIYCSIDGQANPAAINTTIPVDANGIVDVTPQSFVVSNVVCNAPTDVHVVSMRGGIKASTKVSSVGPGFTNIINYRGSAEFGTAKSMINTGVTKGAVGPEPGDVETTAGPHKGPLTIQIRPAQPTSPLVMDSNYSDVLRVTLTPH